MHLQARVVVAAFHATPSDHHAWRGSSGVKHLYHHLGSTATPRKEKKNNNNTSTADMGSSRVPSAYFRLAGRSGASAADMKRLGADMVEPRGQPLGLSGLLARTRFRLSREKTPLLPPAPPWRG